jgi:hypothetical protein
VRQGEWDVEGEQDLECVICDRKNTDDEYEDWTFIPKLM